MTRKYMKSAHLVGKSGIYTITNHLSGKLYIGSGCDLAERRRRHFGNLRRDRHVNSHLQAAWNLYGEEAFRFGVLLCCDRASLVPLEQMAIDIFRNGEGDEILYNQDLVAGSRLGAKHSAKTRRKMSEHNTRPFLGCKHSPEARQRMSEAAKRRCSDPDERERMAAMASHVDSPATRAKKRASALGRPLSEEAKQKVRAAKLGKPRSEETKRKCREGMLRRWQDPEFRKKMAAAYKKRDERRRNRHA